MIKETLGNLFEANTEALTNAVNCVGVMGKGIALQFKQRFPAEYFKTYKIACQNGDLAIGKVQVFELENAQANPRFIINFPTKNHWREQSRIEDIESGLQSLAEAVEQYEIKSIAMPALGCGLGGLNYTKVKPLIEKSFADFPNVEILLFYPIAMILKLNLKSVQPRNKL
ncbi:MAG: macro domain-containing protein [Blastocatellia bacterium]|nr:macro domain-containing protein [Blastocatellia bacterium]